MIRNEIEFNDRLTSMNSNCSDQLTSYTEESTGIFKTAYKHFKKGLAATPLCSVQKQPQMQPMNYIL